MTRLRTTGFEMRAFDGGASEGVTQVSGGTTPVIELTKVRAPGSASAKCVVGATSQQSSVNLTFTGATGTYYYSRMYVYFDTDPATLAVGHTLWQVQTGAAAAILYVQTDGTGKIGLYRAGVGTIGGWSAAMVAATWYRIEVGFMVPASGNGYAALYLNGTQVASNAAQAMGTTAPGIVQMGNVWSKNACTMYLDDCALNDGSGAAQNSFPGVGCVVHCTPTGEAANVGPWVVNHAGDTTYANVGQEPPKGRIQTDTTTVNADLQRAAANTTDYYSATLQTPTVAGVAAGSTVTLAQGVGQHAYSYAGAASGGLAMTSNPVIAEATASTTATAAGTFPTGWNRISTLYSDAPTVNLETAPVITYRKNTSFASRYQMLCYLALQLEVVPGVAPTSQPICGIA